MRRSLRFVLLLLLASSCRRPIETPRSGGDDRPVFIISIDTLRSDHLPAYGYRGGSTPSLDAFRRDAVLFERAFSNVPQTLPSHTTVMTGLMPGTHGVRDNIGYVLGGNVPTLATILRAHGYATGAAISSYVLRRSTGIAAGFDFFDDEVESDAANMTRAERDGEQSRLALEGWLGSRRKVFGFLHLYEPHAPYAPPAAYASIPNPYDGEISYADSIVGHFLETLKQRGIYDDALIVILSDHGEGLGEHGEDEHGIYVYRASLQVPLLIKLPQQQRGGETISNPVALVDVMPTILRALGLDRGRTEGIDALHESAPGRQIFSETWFPRLHLGWSELSSLIGAGEHYIAAPSAELYDYRHDPGETNNILAEQRRVAAAMRVELQKSIRPYLPPSAVDPEDQRKLSALGYVGSTVGSGSALPDPKTKIGSVRLFRSALAAFNTKKDREAQTLLRQLLAESPTFTDGWGLLAQSYRRTGNDAAAVEALTTAMTRFPNDPHVALALADVLFATGKKESARAHARLAMRDTPVLAHEALASFLIKDENWIAARSEAELALREAPTRTMTLLMIAAIDEKLEQFDQALAMEDRAIAQFAARKISIPVGLQRKRGDLLLHLQRVSEAEAAFRAEVQAHPEQNEAWGELALVVAAQGDRQAAEEILRQGLAAHPSGEMIRTATESAQVMGDEAFASQLRAQYGTGK